MAESGDAIKCDLSLSRSLQPDLGSTNMENDDNGRYENDTIQQGDQHDEQSPPEQTREQQDTNAETDRSRSWRKQKYDNDVRSNHQTRLIDRNPFKEPHDGNTKGNGELSKTDRENRHIHRTTISGLEQLQQIEPNAANHSVYRSDNIDWRRQCVRAPEGNRPPPELPRENYTRNSMTDRCWRAKKYDSGKGINTSQINRDAFKERRYENAESVGKWRRSVKENRHIERNSIYDLEQQHIEPNVAYASVERSDDRNWRKQGIREPDQSSSRNTRGFQGHRLSQNEANKERYGNIHREHVHSFVAGAGRWQNIWSGKCFGGRMTARDIQELQNLDPTEIALTLANSNNEFKEALDECPIPLLLDVIAKAFTCHSTNETLNIVYITIKEKGFFNSLAGYFMTMIIDISDENTNEFKQSIADMITIMEELIVTNPTCIPEFVGIHTVLKMVIDALSVKSNIIDDDLVERFRQFTELRDKRLEQSASASVGKIYGARDKVLDAKGPPTDFRDIKVLPQTSDMQMTDDHYLRANKIKGKYNDLDHYLDVQFRLLREDFVAPLRDGIAEFVRSLTEHGKARKGLQDVRIYTNVRIIAPYCSDSGICYTLQIDVSRIQVEWQFSKRLIFGTLLCLSPDAFNTLYFATVDNRDDTMINHGIIQVRFETDHATVKTLIGKTFIMAETSAYYESYRHNLVGLQNIRDGDLPFESYITDCENIVSPPAYVRRNHDVKIDLRPLVDEEYEIIDDKRLMRLGETIMEHTKQLFSEKSNPAKDVSLLQRDTWPSHDLLHLDESQYEAFYTAMTREFVITQGPPGTGKTFIGLKIVKALLYNRNLWNTNPVTGETDNKPMLIVCYTNHALDQFLEGIKKFYKGDILRVGSGSKSHIFANDNLKYYRQILRDKRAFPNHIHQARHYSRIEMNSLNEQIEETCLQIQMASTHIIHEDYLQHFIGQRHYLHLNSQFRSILIDAGIFKKWRKSIIVEWLELGSSAPLVRRIGEHVVPHDEDTQRPQQSYVDVLFGLNNTINEMHQELQHMPKRKYDNEEADLKHISSAENGLRKFKALDVESMGELPDDRSKAGWELHSYARKKLKRNTQKNLASTAIMTEDEASVITELWRLSIQDKWRLYRFWIKQYTDHLWKQVKNKENEYEVAATRYKEAVIQEDKQIMRLSTVIGMTTTCAARYQSVLQDINPRIILVEEAAEVLEAHIITTLTKGCEHLILIGDHKQLKPNPTVYKLAKDYNLDVSLFERMVSNGMRCDCLTLQHRMRPEIAELIKHIYPRLENHTDVQKYESLKGVAYNMFFINHTYNESDDGDLRSHSNIHEASYIASLCRYLMLQGYAPTQITVLTTYSGQLLCLKRLMPRNEFEGIQISVVDNYQGEENDIILLSLVRSNKEGSIGFLKVSNRVCVALSRAKKAFYVIGNFNLIADKSELWMKIKLDIEKKGHIGDGLPLFCQNHHDTDGIIARQASDFILAPEGGCNKKCDYRLNCGHVCGMHCHIRDQEHVMYKCKENCHSILCENGHRCLKKCYEDCGTCNVSIEKTIPECGHKQYISCHEDPSTFDCLEPCTKLLPCKHQCASTCGLACTKYCLTYVKKEWTCGHVGEVRCFEEANVLCPEPCENELCENGHRCGKKCSEECGKCNVPTKKLIPYCGHNQYIPCFQDPSTYACSKPCTKLLPCNHQCASICGLTCTQRCLIYVKKEWSCGHVDAVICFEAATSLCLEPCYSECANGHRCQKTCYEVCGKCNVSIKKTIPECGHKHDMPCHQDPSTFVCSNKCTKRLPCNHQCAYRCDQACTKDCLTYVKKKWPCGHVRVVRCYEAVSSLCPEPCYSDLKCGHMCLGTCGSCFEGRLHRTCRIERNRSLLCGHECNDMSETSSLCSELCNSMCNHSKCSKSCGEICVQCTMSCEWRCKHYKCSRHCSEPCDRPRCNEPCEKCLPCGHTCIGLCGEPCPNECRQCDKDKVATVLFGEEDGENARFVVLQDCRNRCIFEYKAMDKFMDTADAEGEIKLKSCPKCNTPIRRNVRYGSLIKRTLHELEEVKFKIITNRQILFEDNIQLGKGSSQDDTIDCVIAMLDDMPEPKSESRMVALNNQMNMLKAIESLEKKWMKVSEKRKGLANLRKLHEWTISMKSYMSSQNIEDAQLELSRSKDQLMIQYYQRLIRKERKILCTNLTAKIKHAKYILTKQGRYIKQHQTIVQACITELKNESSSIGVTEVERIPIVTASAFCQGHWFKCQNGHVYTIGDFDSATEERKCMECKFTNVLGDDNKVAGQLDAARYATEQRQIVKGVYYIQF